MSDLAKALVKDYSDLGLALKETETSLRSLNGKSLVEFESKLNGDGTPAGMEIFVNGDSVVTLDYMDQGFNSKLIGAIAEPLNF